MFGWSASLARAVSNRSTRSTKRSLRSRSSRTSTKPASVTENIGRASTPCSMRAVFRQAVAKPAAAAAISATAGEEAQAPRKNAAAASETAIGTTIQTIGSRSAAK